MNNKLIITPTLIKSLLKKLACDDKFRSQFTTNPTQALVSHGIVNMELSAPITLPSKSAIQALVTHFQNISDNEYFRSDDLGGGWVFNTFVFRAALPQATKA